MAKSLNLTALVIFLATPALAQTKGVMVPPVDSQQTLNATSFQSSFDSVWEAALEVISSHRLKVVSKNKSKGQIRTNFLVLSRHPRFSSYSQGVRAFATVPRKFLKKWIDGRIRVNLILRTLSGGATRMELFPEVEGFAVTRFDEAALTGDWHPCRSNGTFEFEFFNEIATKLANQRPGSQRTRQSSVETPGSSGVSQLMLRSTPEGAEIYIDRELVGMTPSRLSLSPGEHQILLRKPGFKDFQREVVVLADSYLTISAELE